MVARNKGSPFGMNISTVNLATKCVTEEKLAADDEVAGTFFLGPVTHDFGSSASAVATKPVSYTHLRAHETPEHLVCSLLLEKKKR